MQLVLVAQIRNRHVRWGNGPSSLFDVIESLTPALIRESFQVPLEYLDHLKFSECLPPHYADQMIKERLLPLDILRSAITQRRKVVVC
jgi:hypothetical protein